MTKLARVAAVTATLKYVVGAAVHQMVPDAEVSMLPPEEQSAASADTPRVNIYLVQVAPSAFFETERLPARTADTEWLTPPLVPLDLRYLVSYFGPTLSGQLMLGAVEAAFAESPFLSPSMIQAGVANDARLTDSKLEVQDPPVRLSQRPLPLEDLARFWSGFFESSYTLSTVYDASPVFLQNDVALKQRHLVEHPVGRTATPLESPPGAPDATGSSGAQQASSSAVQRRRKFLRSR